MKEMALEIKLNDSQIRTRLKEDLYLKEHLYNPVSVFIFNTSGRLMLQQRSFTKSHSAGLWSNTCCSHPHMDETAYTAAQRGLLDEMGFKCTFSHHFKIKISAKEKDQEIKDPLSDIFIGYSNQLPSINPMEATAYRLMTIDEIREDITEFPEKYTSWFRFTFPVIEDIFMNEYSQSKLPS